MSARRERMLAEIDHEIGIAVRQLQALREARGAIARSLPVAPRRKTAASRPDRVEASLEALVAQIMADGRTWTVDNVLSAVIRAGVPTNRPEINSVLYRGSRGADARFAVVTRGHYRVRPPAGQEGERGIPH